MWLCSLALAAWPSCNGNMTSIASARKQSCGGMYLSAAAGRLAYHGSQCGGGVISKRPEAEKCHQPESESQ